MSHGAVLERERSVPIAGQADVVVAGGGPAGIAAALAAARSGAETCLLEVHGCLGGVWTAGQLAWMFELEQPGIAAEITAELDRRGAKRGQHPGMYTYDVEAMKLLLDELCVAAGVRFQLQTRVCAALRGPDGRIEAVCTESKSGRQAWTADCFVDTTGDGDLGALAGCGFAIGRPDSGECQPLTYMALVTVPDPARLARFISFWSGQPDFTQHLDASAAFLAEIRRGGVDPSYARPTLFAVRDRLLALMINHEYGVRADDAAALTAATVRGRAEVNRVVDALRSLGGPWAELQLVATCEQIGVREGRRLRGLAAVSSADLRDGARHLDAVCRAHFGVDVHNTNPNEGKGQEEPPFRSRPYDIPYRALVAADVPNLLFAGRCLSGDFLAHSSYRVTGVAVATGQAAGAAAALAARQGVAPAELTWPDLAAGLATLGWQPPGE